MCLIKRATTSRGESFIPCNNSDRTRPCDNSRVEEPGRGSDNSSQMALLPSSTSTNNQVVLHQDRSPRRNEPRQERRYAGEIGVRFRGFFKSPEFSIRRLDDGGSGSRSRSRRGDSEGWSSVEVMPECPMPPPAHAHHSHRRPPPPPPPPPSMPPTIISPPDRPTPPQGPGAAAAVATRNTAPLSSKTPSRTSSIKSGDSKMAVQDIPHSTAPALVPSVTSNRTHRSTRGLTRLRFDPNTRFRDSAYGSSNMSPVDAISTVDAPKAETLSETHSNTTSERNANQRFNYANDNAMARREDYDNDDEEIRSNSSGSRKSYRIVRRVRGTDNPEEAERRMQEDMRAAEDHQSRTSEQGDGSVRSGSGSGRRRHRRRTSDE
jgi:hypothetical protein